jgi:uncharacterized Zn-binding protein involved in type VI secretion
MEVIFMKTKISHLGRSSVSVILAVMMLLSTMLIGTISVNAADFFTVGDTLYLDISGAKYDATADNAEFYIKFYKDGDNSFSWSKLSQIKDKVYSGTVPTGEWDRAVFTRVNSQTFDSTKSWIASTVYSSATTTISDKGNHNCWSLNNGDMKGTWTTYSDGSGGGSTSTAYYVTGETGLINSTNAWTQKQESDKMTYSDTDGYYSITYTDRKSGIYKFKITDNNGAWFGYSEFDDVTNNGCTIENSSGDISVKFDQKSNVTIKFNIDSQGKKHLYVIAESALSKVADSVTLTASPETVKVGNSVTLTAVANNPASANLRYTFTKTSDGGANETQNNDKLTVTPTAAGTYKYKVTVSADGYSPVTSNEVSFTVIDSVKYYICGRFNGKWHSPLASDPQFVEDESKPGLFYYETGETIAQLSGNITEDYGDRPRYFYINKDVNENNNYLTTSDKAGHNFQNNTFGSPLTLENKTGTEEKRLVRFNDVNNTSTTPVTIWLDTRNGKYKLWYTTALSYTVTVADGVSATVDKETATAGETVTVTATPENGKVLDTVTVVGADNTPVTTTVSGNTATFTMPDQNVTVTGVTFRTANTYTVKFSSNNSEYGTVSAMKGATSITSPATVTEGDTVTFTATPKDGYALSDWTATANGTSNTYNDSSLSLKITANTTVTANFKVEDSGTIVNNMYFLYGSTNNPTSWEGQQGYNQSGYGKYNVYEKDGKYIVTLNKEHYKQLYFAFSTSNYYKNMTPKDKLAGVNPDNPVDLRLVTTGKESFNADNTQYVFGMMSIVSENSEYIGDIKIIYDPTANTYTVKATKDSASDTTVNITGKDGTIRAGFTNTGDKKTTAVLGDTTLSITTPDDKIITASDSYKIDGKNRAVTAKKVPYGSTVTVTTTIDPDATFAGHNGSDYYVKGFSVNGIFGGVLSQTDGKAHGSNEYTYEFKVNQEIYGSKLEITPVYFLKDDANCVYFYIENYDSAKQIWGNTPSCYVYYGSGKTTLEALGYYPGQPMVDYNGSIFTQIPKSIDNGSTRVDITGMTLNNYVWDDVHKDYNGKNQKEDNAQTYDYDDFVKIAESSVAPDNIIYRFKYNEFKNEPKATLEASKADPNGWEVFLDYQNYPTDIFGNRIGTAKLDYKDTQSVTSQGNYLSIISDGYQNNYIGKYATAWSIYNKDGDRVATIPSSALGKSDEQMTTAIGSASTPADFLPGKKDRDTYWKTFKTLYNDYKDVYARINFEAAITGGGEKGNRLDGRWYYSQSKQKITGEIKIQYANTLDDYKVGDFNEDKFADEDASSIVGTTTGASAYFTNPKDKVRKLETFADNTQDYKFEVNATSTAAYTFVGWYRLIDGDYKAINPSNMSSLTGAVTQNSDVTLVARYIKTPGGSMTFQHSLYNGENAGGGKATTEIQVVVKDSKGKSLYDSGKIPGTASIDKNMIADFAKQEGLTVTVTLYTTTKNLYNFKGYYSAENTTDITAFAPTTDDFTTGVSGNRRDGLVTTSEYTFSFNDYYTRYSDILTATDAGTVYYNFYSDITSIKVPYKVQFSYTDRMGDQKYYNKAGYVDPENTSSYTIVEDTTNVEGVKSHSVKVTLTDSFILSLAPYESNFTKNLTWNKTPVSNTAFDSSVTNSIASAVVNSTQSDKKIHLNVFRDGKGVPTPRTNTAGAFKLFTKNDSPELPYGSVFYTSNGDGTYTYDITAPKTYTDESGNVLKFKYWEIYSDSKCEPEDLVIKAYNSEGHFSYVAYDNCWIVPVYGKSSTPVASVKEVSTSTQFMEVTRNQWTAKTDSAFAGFDADSMNTLDTNKDFIKGNDEDKLYADFVLNFFYNGKQLSVFDPDSSKVQTGIVMQKLKLENDSIGVGYNTDMKYYANKYINDLPVAAEDAKNKILTGKSSIESLTKQINNNRLDNKNRLQYYARFNNTEANANCVYRVYTYIKYVNESNVPVVKLGDPIYFTLYDVANATV